MTKYPPLIVMLVFGICCFTMGGIVARLGLEFSSPVAEPGAEVAMAEAPARLSFSSPSSEAGASKLSAPAFTMRVSAYCPCEICCGEFADGYTASGVRAVGKIVAAPPDMPFGTVLEIPGYGRCRVQDRGGAITEGRLDVLFSTHEQAKQWGVQVLEVRVYE